MNERVEKDALEQMIVAAIKLPPLNRSSSASGTANQINQIMIKNQYLKY